MLLTVNADAMYQITVFVMQINIGIRKHATAAANQLTYIIAIALITQVEDLNTGTSFNANVCALSQVQKKQLQNLTILGSILNLVNGFQDLNHVLPAITGTLIQNLACASDKHAPPHTHGLTRLANASAILL